MLLGLLNSDGKSTRKPVASRRHLVAWMDGQWEIPGGGLDHGIRKKHGHIIYKLTGAKRREWMGCWGLLGWFTRDFAWIIPENSLRLAPVCKWCFNGTIIEVNIWRWIFQPRLMTPEGTWTWPVDIASTAQIPSTMGNVGLTWPWICNVQKHHALVGYYPAESWAWNSWIWQHQDSHG